MKQALIGLAAILTIALAANAQIATVEIEEQSTTAPAEIKKERPKPVPILKQIKADIDKAVQLSDDQKKAIDKIILSAEASKQELAEAFKPIKESYDKALKEKDEAIANRIIEDWRNLYKRQADINSKAVRDMLDTLSAEKLDKWYNYNLARLLKSFAELKLSKEQIEKIKQEYIRIIKDTSLEPWMVDNNLYTYVYKEVITAEQKTAQIMTNIPQMYAKLKLTKEQLEKITQECIRLNKDSSVDPNMVWFMLSQYIQNDVITGEQRAAQRAEYEKEYRRAMSEE